MVLWRDWAEKLIHATTRVEWTSVDLLPLAALLTGPCCQWNAESTAEPLKPHKPPPLRRKRIYTRSAFCLGCDAAAVGAAALLGSARLNSPQDRVEPASQRAKRQNGKRVSDHRKEGHENEEEARKMEEVGEDEEDKWEEEESRVTIWAQIDFYLI